ncbi:MarR family winged helix-turn-helix transcriptional regulator [Streptomyces sp. SYSU K21746]
MYLFVGSDGQLDRVAGPAEDPLHDVARQVAEAAEALMSTWAKAAQAALPRLSSLQSQALLIARRSPGINLTGLAAEVGAAPPTASRLCDRLEAAGLLRRERAPGNRREVGLTLTLHGHEMVDALFARRTAAICEVLSRVPAARRGELLAGLRAFAEAAVDPGDFMP